MHDEYGLLYAISFAVQLQDRENCIKANIVTAGEFSEDTLQVKM